MFKVGDIAYFREAKNGLRKSSQGVKAQGHFFGIMLGMIPPSHTKEPAKDQLARSVGMAGYLTFNDVAEFFGPKIAEECVRRFELKYWGKRGSNGFYKVPFWLKALAWVRSLRKSPYSCDAVDAATPAPAKSSLVDPRGRPL